MTIFERPMEMDMVVEVVWAREFMATVVWRGRLYPDSSGFAKLANWCSPVDHILESDATNVWIRGTSTHAA
jgi:hypothetical protein